MSSTKSARGRARDLIDGGPAASRPSGVNARGAGEDRRSLLACSPAAPSCSRRDEFPLAARRRHLPPGRGSRPPLRALRLGRRPGQAGAAAQPHHLGGDRRRLRRRAQRVLRARRDDGATEAMPARRGAGQGLELTMRPATPALPARRLPHHRDAGRSATRCTCTSTARPRAPARPHDLRPRRPAGRSASWRSPKIYAAHRVAAGAALMGPGESSRSSTCARKACSRPSGHPFFATSAPAVAARAAHRARCVPRRDAHRAGGRRRGSQLAAQRAARVLRRLGYRDLARAGGRQRRLEARRATSCIPACNVPSKAFGEHRRAPRRHAAHRGGGAQGEAGRGRRPGGARFAADEANSAR